MFLQSSLSQWLKEQKYPNKGHRNVKNETLGPSIFQFSLSGLRWLTQGSVRWKQEGLSKSLYLNAATQIRASSPLSIVGGSGSTKVLSWVRRQARIHTSPFPSGFQDHLPNTYLLLDSLRCLLGRKVQSCRTEDRIQTKRALCCFGKLGFYHFHTC